MRKVNFCFYFYKIFRIVIVLTIASKRIVLVLILVVKKIYYYIDGYYNKDETWHKSCGYMNGILNVILLLRQGVESNPGPPPNSQKSNFSVRTYNCNGLGITDKEEVVLI